MKIVFENDFQRIEIDDKNHLQLFSKKMKKYKKLKDEEYKALVEELNNWGIQLSFSFKL